MEAWGECEQSGESGAYLKFSTIFVGTGVLDGPCIIEKLFDVKSIGSSTYGNIKKFLGLLGPSGTPVPTELIKSFHIFAK